MVVKKHNFDADKPQNPKTPKPQNPMRCGCEVVQIYKIWEVDISL